MAGHIDLFYGDESRVSEQGYIPYGWQFKDEDVCIRVEKGKGLNCFAMISRDNRCIYSTTKEKVTAKYIIEQLDRFSFSIHKPTVVVLDNAKVHTAASFKERLQYWQNRGLYIFYLPAYSPQLNIAERLWKELKARWIRPQDYLSSDSLFYAVTLAMAAVGNCLFIRWGTFKYISN